MRTIQFRWFNIKNNCWLYWNYLINRWRHFITQWDIEVNPFATPEDYEVDIKSVWQFTWLYAKWDTEIYEWDILKYKSSKIELSEVYYQWTCFKITQQSNRTTRSLDYHLQKYNAEIVWNLFQNNELVKI